MDFESLLFIRKVLKSQRPRTGPFRAHIFSVMYCGNMQEKAAVSPSMNWQLTAEFMLRAIGLMAYICELPGPLLNNDSFRD